MEKDTQEQVGRLARTNEMMQRERWFAPMKGGLPQIPNRDALPDASADLAFCIVGLRDASDDAVYICVKDTGTWTWKAITLA